MLVQRVKDAFTKVLGFKISLHTCHLSIFRETFSNARLIANSCDLV